MRMRNKRIFISRLEDIPLDSHSRVSLHSEIGNGPLRQKFEIAFTLIPYKYTVLIITVMLSYLCLTHKQIVYCFHHCRFICCLRTSTLIFILVRVLYKLLIIKFWKCIVNKFSKWHRYLSLHRTCAN